MAKITPRESKTTMVVKTKTNKSPTQAYSWWKADTKAQVAEQLISTAGYLKEQQQYRYRQAAIYSRLYGNLPLFNAIGNNFNRMTSTNSLPIDRPTMNVVQSNVDTLVSRISQARPRPIFLTDNGDYKQRNLAKQLNNFLMGEFYQTKMYELGPLILRDAAVLGTGCLKFYKTYDNKVGIDRVLYTDLLVDPNDSLYGDPRQLYHFKLVDRDVLAEHFPKYRSDIMKAENAYPDASGESSKTVADQVMVVEGWRLPSCEGATDGRHTIACSSGVISDEQYDKQKFPFVFMHYSPRLLGFWGQGLGEQLMGTQVEINKLLSTITKSINLVGVPRVFLPMGSKVVKAHLNNEVGSIVTYQGEKPSYEVAPCVPQEMYAQLQRLVEYSYQQSGVSALAATAQKPAGLNSGEAIRNYDDLQSDRFAALVKRYDNMYVDAGYQIMDQAIDIAKETGKYQTVYPNKNGAREIDLPQVKMLEDPFVLQCFDSSSLPRDPAGRLQKITEMMQAGIIDPQEGRRLLDYPDLEQNEKLANSGKERILKILDDIIDTGEYVPPDPFMDPTLARKLVIQYYNLYSSAKLEEDKCEKLRNWKVQVDALIQASMPPPQPEMNGAQAVPQARPVSELLPNTPGAMAS